MTADLTTPIPTERESLAAVGLSHVYGAGTSEEHRALGDITFSVDRGEFVAIVGPSGCGKTTLLRCLSGLMTPTSGSITLDGAPVASVPKDLTLVFQDYRRSLYPWLRVDANVEFPLRYTGIDKRERAERVRQALDDVGLTAHRRKYPGQLSGGMQQRVSIARALAYRPHLLLMDEPFASVDAQTRASLEDVLLDVWERRDKTVLFVTHDIDESVYLADRVVVLSNAPARVMADLAIDIPRPRDQIETKTTPKFVELRAEVARLIRDARNARRRARTAGRVTLDPTDESRPAGEPTVAAARPTLTAGGAVFARLARLGVDVVFVNSGTDFPPIIEGLAEADSLETELPRTVLVAHEHAAMGMAHGYFFATGRAQAVMLHTNVGLSNGATGAINAATDRVSMIVMSGRTPTLEEGRFGARTVPIGWGQEMRDQPALVREACKWEYELRFPEQLPQLLDRAHAIAASTPTGPVYLSLPREVLCEPCPSAELDRAPAMAAARVVAPQSLLAEAARLLAGARRPLVIAQRGAGDQDGFDALARLADRWSIPVCQYWAVATAISAHHPMYVGQDLEPWISEADVVLVIDSLAPWSPDIHRLRDDCRVVHLGPDPLEARFPVRNFRSDLSVTSEVGPGLVGLERALQNTPDAPPTSERTAWRTRVEHHAAERRTQLADLAAAIGAGPLTKASVARAVGRALRGSSVTVVSELGCPLDPLELTDHGSWRQEPHSGGLGWGLPCALGIKLADPDRLVIATVGDGSYMFANPVACHQVAEANNIAVLTIVLNDSGYGAVRNSVLGLYPTGYAAKFDDVPLTGLAPSPDFAHIAEASRAYAETVTHVRDLAAALDRALRVVTVDRRQALLDVRIVD